MRDKDYTIILIDVDKEYDKIQYPLMKKTFNKYGIEVCCCLVTKSCPTLYVTPRTTACQAPLSMEIPRQEYWSVLSFSSPGDLPGPRIEPTSLSLQADSLTLRRKAP